MDEPILLSALNQYAYCPRRCYLIHAEGEFEDNIHTQRGSAEHERVDEEASRSLEAGGRVEYALPIWSEQLGLIGKCDVVEFHGDGTIYPVEYKHGKRRKWLNDDLQLTAQAMCLEEMLGKPVPRGAIYHASSKRRREVEFTAALRKHVEETVIVIRALLASGQIPPPVNDARCRECSLKDICQPEILAAKGLIRVLAATLYEPEA
jgi:CRISPR-associated exonuclease Cas4